MDKALEIVEMCKRDGVEDGVMDRPRFRGYRNADLRRALELLGGPVLPERAASYRIVGEIAYLFRTRPETRRDHSDHAGRACTFVDGACAVCNVGDGECDKCDGRGYHTADCPDAD